MLLLLCAVGAVMCSRDVFIKKQRHDFIANPNDYSGHIEHGEILRLLVNSSVYSDGCEDMVFIDVGANHGQGIEQLMEISNCTGWELIAIEPQQKLVDQYLIPLAKLAKDAGKGIVHVLHAGVGMTEGVAPAMFIPAGGSDQHPSFNHPRGHKMDVAGGTKDAAGFQIVTLDALTRDYVTPYVDFMKVDTEGYEYEVFHGAMEMLKKGFIGVIFYECNNFWHENVHHWTMYNATKFFDNLEYDNFAVGKNRLIVMNIPFYQEVYGRQAWRNCLAVSRKVYPGVYRSILKFDTHFPELPSFVGPDQKDKHQ